MLRRQRQRFTLRDFQQLQRCNWSRHQHLIRREPASDAAATDDAFLQMLREAD